MSQNNPVSVPDFARSLFERMRLENQERLKQFRDDTTDIGSKIKIDPKFAQYEASIREDMGTMALIEEEAKQYFADLIAKNQCTLSEYRAKYLILHQLFEHSGYSNKHDFYTARNQASEDYMRRFSPFHPMRILDDVDQKTVLCTIPPISVSPNMIHGYDCAAVDQFEKFADHDRPDISRGVQSELINAVVRAQGTSVEDRIAQHANTHYQSLQVLKVFFPDHPAVQEMNRQHNQNEQQDQKNPKEEAKSAEPVKGIVSDASGSTVIGDISDDDLF